MVSKRLYRSRENRMICGVAGGLGAYFDVDPTVVRLILVIGLLAGLFPVVLLYLAGCILVPDEPIVD